MRDGRRGAAWRAWLAALALLGLVLQSCSSGPETQRDDGDTLPWNKPEEWERQPNMKAPMTW
jgi:hypothetical protein